MNQALLEGGTFSQPVLSSRFKLDENDFEMDMTTDDLVKSQGTESLRHPKTLSAPSFKLLKVTEIIDLNVGDEMKSRRKVVQSISRNGENPITRTKLELRGEWGELEIKVGDEINLIIFREGESLRGEGRIVVDDKSPYIIILHPNELVNVTNVSSSFDCLRKAVISTIFRSNGVINKKALLGILAHEMFQISLKERNFSSKFVKESISKIVKNNLVEILSSNLTDKEVNDFLLAFIPKIARWGPRYMRTIPLSTNNQNSSMLCIPEIVDIEETICSPVLGFKGKIDSTVRLRKGKKRKKDFNNYNELIAALEIKSGSSFCKEEHFSQVVIYNTLLAEKYQKKFLKEGLLFYLSNFELSEVPTKMADLKAIFLRRNQISIYVKNRKLPPMIDSPHHCARCYENDKCFIYQKSQMKSKLSDEKNRTFSSETFLKKSKAINKNAAEYILKWKKMIDLEEKTNKFDNFWGKSSSDAEEDGKCLGEMQFLKLELKNNSFKSHFRRKIANVAINQLKWKKGQRIIVSKENGPFYIFKGYLEDTIYSKNSLEISIFSNQKPNQLLTLKNEFYRLDVEEYNGSFSLLRANVINTFVDTENSLGNFVTGHSKPKFSNSKMNQCALLPEMKTQWESLNHGQKQAVEKVMSAENFSLIYGMPGTGKSTTIAFILKLLSRLKFRVLVVAYTHSAIDHLLSKLLKLNVKFVRIGNRKNNILSISNLSPFFIETIQKGCNSVAEFEKKLDGFNIFGTTSLSISASILSYKQFDYCIVDEASQMHEAAILGPLQKSTKFVLVGDHNQLNPLVCSKEAKEMGMDISLFERLLKAHPEAVATLKNQYRMNKNLMDLSNRLFYEGKLRCGSKEVSQANLTPNGNKNVNSKTVPLWLKRSLNIKENVLFLSTDEIGGIESYKGPSKSSYIINKFEGEIILKLLTSFRESGVLENNSFVVLSTYRSQVKYLNDLVEDFGVEVNTVDQFQGRESDCVILSLVRSNSNGNVGVLVKDLKRLSVALTRAKKKLLIIGSINTLKSDKRIAEMIEFMEGKGWINLV